MSLLVRAFEDALGKLINLAEPFATEKRDPNPLAETWKELITSHRPRYRTISMAFAAEVAARATNWNEGGNDETRDNATLHAVPEKAYVTWLNLLPRPDQAD